MTQATAMMTVRIQCFAQLRDRLGQSELSVMLPRASTAREVLHVLRARYPSAAPLLDVSRLAVNWEYLSEERILHEGDDVAIIPPVSGG